MPQPASSFSTIFSIAFRSLFLAGGLFSILAISWWIYYWSAPFAWSPYGGIIWWHAHEMIFGFGLAIVVGFLLTAVRTWTGVESLSAASLFGLLSLWILGRIVISFNLAISDSLVTLIDLSFILVSAAALSYPIIKVKQWRNIMFVPILLIFALLNATSHWAINGNQSILAINSFHTAILLFTLMVVIIGGRVIPMFTANGAGCKKATPIKTIEVLSILPVALLVFFTFYGINQLKSTTNFANLIYASLAILAAISNLLRSIRWGIQYTWCNPLLWSLHLAYLFIPIGFLLLASYSLDLISNLSAAIHSLTIGAIGGMIIAMTSRVSLGHTGRSLKVNWVMGFAFALVFLAALIRIILPLALTEFYLQSIIISGGMWALSFLIFLIVYATILLSPRVDSRRD